MKRFKYMTITLGNLLSVMILVILSLCSIIGYDVACNIKSASSSVATKPTVIIDAGHGGEDGGTVSHSGIPEKDINLKIAIKLNKLFTENNYQTIMIRETDKLIYDDNCNTIRQKKSSDLHNRLNIINSNDNAVLISIHQNHFDESKYYGAQVFYSPNLTDSKLFANEIQQNIVNNIQPENTRQIKETGKEIFLLYNAKIPSVMVECGFLSNIKEAELLNTDDYQSKISECIFEATDKFVKKKGDLYGK